VHHEKTAVGASVPPLLTLGAIDDTADASSGGGTNTSTTVSSIANVGLVGGLITANGVTSQAAASHGPSGYAISDAGTQFANLVVAGIPIPITVPPNTVIPVPLLGTVTLNEQKGKADANSASLSINAIHVDVTSVNAFGIAVGTQIYVAHAFASLKERTVSALVGGSAYGLSGDALGGVAHIGRVAPVSVSCLGTGGKTRHNTSAGINIPGIVSSGTVDDTAKGNVHNVLVKTTSTVEGLNLLNSLVGATTIEAVADGIRVHGADTFDHTGSLFLNLTVAGFPNIGDDVPPNTTLDIAGLGTLYLFRVIHSSNGLEVRMIELKVTQNNAYGLPIGADIRVAVAKVRIH
jgi:hypothetical protein